MAWASRLSADRNRWLRFVGGLLVISGLFNAYWPPMHQREVIAAGGGTLTDAVLSIALLRTSRPTTVPAR